MTPRPTKGRCLLYTRDSEGRQRTTFEEYVRWAQQKSKELGLQFCAAAGQIDAMIRAGKCVEGDVFIDFGIAGDELNRPGLNALMAEIRRDRQITHVCCPRRDRLARATDPAMGMQLENTLSRLGVWLIFQDDAVPPIAVGDAPEIDRLAKSMFGSFASGKEVRELAKKMVFVQTRLARDGHAAGGRPPFGFERWLVDGQDQPVRRLADKETVSLPGHHVDWLPTCEGHLAIVRRIFALLDSGLSARRVASILTADGTPTPDSGRYRTDGGHRHPTAGVWHTTMIVSLVRNPTYAGLHRVGRRSMGKYSRFTPEGPRPLNEEDLREDRKPKVVQNPASAIIEVSGRFTPPIPRDQWDRVNRSLEQRAGVQRSRPRRRRPESNPLQGRIYDMHCSWPMYRAPVGKKVRYVCGLNVQSHGHNCKHNSVDSGAALRFVMGYTRDQILRHDILEKLRSRVTEIAHQDLAASANEDALQRLRRQLSQIEEDAALNLRNLGRAKSDDQYQALSQLYDRTISEKKTIESEIAALEHQRGHVDVEAEVQAAMDQLDHLEDLATQPESLVVVHEIVDLINININMFLRFEDRKWGTRAVRAVAGGVLTTGSAPFPIQPYQGRTAWKEVKEGVADLQGTTGEGGSRTSPPSKVSGRKADSLRNSGRGGRI